MDSIRLRPITPEDRSELADLIYISINYWYQTHGMPALFSGGPQVSDIFCEVYNDLDPGCAVVAQHPQTGRLMGSCFYHPREHHVSLGIMNVHPNYFRTGVGRAMLQYIVEFTDRGGYKSLRLTQSALNLDSFSLYTRAGFVPRLPFQDMLLSVPAAGLSGAPAGTGCVRPARLADVPAMGHLEREVSGITRDGDYRYFIENRLGFWRVSVFENAQGKLDGWMVSSGHPAFNMIGPGVARSEAEAAALIFTELNNHKGRTPVTLVPMHCASLVRQMYDWGARNCELHLYQVRGEFRPFQGVSMPTFLPESG